jgi:hypothetical protein
LVDAGLDLAADSHKRPPGFDGRIQRWRVKGEDNEFRGWTKAPTGKAGAGTSGRTTTR